MTIHGGGKLPQQHTQAHGTERPRRAADKRLAAEQGAAQPAKAAPKQDVFETGFGAPMHTPARGIPATTATAAAQAAGIKLEDVLGTPSQIKQMAEAIGAHARRLAGEFDGLRTEAQQVVNGLAGQGFAPGAVAETRDQLGELRRQMAHLRGRIAADGRRLKLLKAAAGKLGDTKLSEKVSGQLKKLDEMERGWGRAFLALGIAGTLSHSVDEGPGAHRVALGAGAGVDRHALGSYVAQAAPGSAASQLLVALLEEGPHAPPGRLIAEAYAELHADVMAGRLGKALQGLGLWRQAMT
ncbi:MAG: hypothetical protein HY904_17200 [Deltaproteobacteria bacterium]|nr:hypothetical protein [Deltaproteobacteria bacterium]